MPDYTPMVHAERQSLSDFLGTLTPEQWTETDAVRQVERPRPRRPPHRGGQHHRAALLRWLHQDRASTSTSSSRATSSNYNGGSPADVKSGSTRSS